MTNNPVTPVPDSTPTRTDDAVLAPAQTDAQPTSTDSVAPSSPAATDSAAPSSPAPHASAQAPDANPLDHGTYTSLVEPRSPRRLELDEGVWHQISRKYLWVQLISSGIMLVIIVTAMLVLALALGQRWAYIPGGILIALIVWAMAILPRQVRAIGYQLRQDDLVFRRGILWQRMVAVPYGRMQLVDITHGPLDRGFGIAQLKFVTAAATTGVTIPGLEQGTAEMLRDHLVEVAESRRTGL